MTYHPVSTMPVTALPRGTSGLAVAGFVFAFVFAPLGLVLSLFALARTGPGREGGRGLAVSGVVISGLLVVVGLAILGAAANAAEESARRDEGVAPDPAAAATAGGAQPPPPAAAEGSESGPPGLGVPVTDGEFTFTVDSVERIGTSVGNEWANETAQGEFVLIRVTVTNTGDEARTLSYGDQDLYDTAGRLFQAQSGWFLVEGGEDSFFRTINPGLTVTGAPLLYDVPPGVQLDRIELHDSWYAQG